MIPSDHFVRFYNEVFKFLDARDALEPYYREISRHQELHCLELFRKEGLKGLMKYYEHIHIEENCGMELELLPDRMILRMTCCPSLSKVLDSDAEPCPKYCDHCGGWGVPLYVKCGIYYVGNMISRTEPRCEIVYTESREVAREVYRKFLDAGYSADLIQTNLDDWEEVEKNRVERACPGEPTRGRNDMHRYEKITDFDREIWQEELEDFVPAKIFDAHTHLWDNEFAPPEGTTVPETHWDDLDRWSREVFPGREIGFLMLGMPVAGMKLAGFHDFMAREIAKSRHRLGSTIVTPKITAAELDGLVRRHRFAGLKPYRSFAKDPANCRIVDYFPEAQMEVADHHRLAVTLHMAKFDGIADPENLADLADLTRRYPHIRWILAHCARAFNPYTLEKSVFVLRDLPNIYYDLSAVCDARSHYLLMKHEELSRLMFGTDNICAGGVHAKYVTWGKGWQYFTGMDVPHCRGDATLVCYEQLRAMKQAADMAGLTQADTEAVFYRNAATLFGF